MSEIPKIVESVEVETELLIEKPKKGRKPKPIIVDDGEEVPPKPKRPMSAKQSENIYKAIEKRKQIAEEKRLIREAEDELKREEKALQDAEKKREIERKIVKKAVVIKKREILEQTALDEISDDDIPDKLIQKIVKKQQLAKKTKSVVQPIETPVPEPVVPKYVFV